MLARAVRRLRARASFLPLPVKRIILVHFSPPFAVAGLRARTRETSVSASGSSVRALLHGAFIEAQSSGAKKGEGPAEKMAAELFARCIFGLPKVHFHTLHWA